MQGLALCRTALTLHHIQLPARNRQVYIIYLPGIQIRVNLQPRFHIRRFIPLLSAAPFFF